MSDDPDEDDDPFATMDAPDDESDPFEDLASATDDDPSGPTGDQGGGNSGSETSSDGIAGDAWAGTDAAESDATSGGDSSADDDTASPGTPDEESWVSADEDGWSAANAGSTSEATGEADDLFTQMEGPRTGRSADEDEGEDPFEAFESTEVDEVDPDEIWDRLSQAERGDDDISFDEKVYYEVSKHRFCQQCEHFSKPPETSCSYEGADIVEFLDMETVRLVNCPIVAEYRELSDETST